MSAPVYPINLGGNESLTAPSSGMVAIYGLFDPRSGALRYIGKSVSPLKRLSEHLGLAEMSRSTHKARWLRKLASYGLGPVLRVLAWVPDSEWKQYECAYIATALEMGHDLTNATLGGEGTSGTIPSAETRRKLSAAARERWSSLYPEERDRRVSQAIESVLAAAENNRGKKRSAETRKKQSVNSGARNKSPEWRANIGTAQRGRKGKPWNDKQREVHENQKLSPGHKAALIAGNIARWERYRQEKAARLCAS